MDRREFLRNAGLGAAALMTGWQSASAGQPDGERPNIVLIMSDDMGFSDIGCYGSEIHTPNLDRLAAGGIRFTQFYNTARCCPTRASLLTGLYQHQARIGHMMRDNDLPGYQGDLGKNAVTIAEALGRAGYNNYMSGKWHVTPHTDPDGPKYNWPLQRGFDRFFGTIHGAGSFYDPNSLTRDNTLIPPTSDDFYYTDAISDNASKYIRDHKRKQGDNPFFMYVAYTAAHWPMHAKPEDIAKYEGRYDEGWQAIRHERYKRMLEMDVLEHEWDLSPRDAELWEDVSEEDKEWHRRRMEVYAAMVDSMDQGIGRIVKALKETGMYENTLILFLQDNGGCAEEFGSRGKIRPAPGERPDGEPLGPNELQTRMVPKFTRNGRPVRQGHGVMPGPADTYIAYGREWANVSNTPFRLYKHWVHEGGISTPLIAHWPAGIKRHGEFERQPGHLIDIMATCCDVAEAEYPEEYDGHEITPAQGKSLTPVFEGKQLQPRSIYFEHEGNRAIRRGKWKLVAKGAGGEWELYDMEKDRSELNDLSDERPGLAKDMEKEWEKFAKRAHMLPWPWGGMYETRSKKTHFELTHGDSLQRYEAPDVVKRPFSVKATLRRSGDSGVIVAQGGSNLGWSLYLDGGQLAFAMQRKGKRTVVQADEKAPSGKFDVSVDVGKNKVVTITVNGKEVVSEKIPGFIPDMPLDALEVGRDSKGAVGKYNTPNKLSGKVEEVVIDLPE